MEMPDGGTKQGETEGKEAHDARECDARHEEDVAPQEEVGAHRSTLALYLSAPEEACFPERAFFGTYIQP